MFKGHFSNLNSCVGEKQKQMPHAIIDVGSDPDQLHCILGKQTVWRTWQKSTLDVRQCSSTFIAISTQFSAVLTTSRYRVLSGGC